MASRGVPSLRQTVKGFLGTEEYFFRSTPSWNTLVNREKYARAVPVETNPSWVPWTGNTKGCPEPVFLKTFKASFLSESEKLTAAVPPGFTSRALLVAATMSLLCPPLLTSTILELRRAWSLKEFRV